MGSEQSAYLIGAFVGLAIGWFIGVIFGLWFKKF